MTVEELRRRFDLGYMRLSHESRRTFDVLCAERAIQQCQHYTLDPRVTELLELARSDARLGLARSNAPNHEREALREAVYLRYREMDDDFPSRIAENIARAVLAASAPLILGAANSDYWPTSANQARDAIYIDTYVRTNDSDAADAARLAELEWQTARIEAFLAAQK